MSTINFPLTTTSLFVNTINTNKIIYLPAASTVNAGRLFYIKDICGNAATSSIYILTTGMDRIESRSSVFAAMSTNYGSVLMAPDGALNWYFLQHYHRNAIAASTPVSSGVGTVTFTNTFTYTGSLQTFVVPTGVTSVRLYMWGAGGGTSSPVGGFVAYSGGAGAMVQGVYSVTPGSTLYIVVGKGGVTNQSIQTDAEGGGGAANSAGGGGGRSAIQLSAGGADVVVAGGGGGGGLLYGDNNGTGGPAYFSGSSPNTLAAVTGYGGTQTAGGAGGGNGGGAGTLKFGGAGTGPGAGGGGGYYGGGGMGNGDQGWGPGGGGSSLINNLSLIPGESVLGFNSPNLSGAPNTSSPYYQSNIAAGGIGANATGGNGLVIITYQTIPTVTPTSIANIALWLDGADASTITTVTGVSQWNDKSGNAYNLTQSTTNLQPTRTGNYLNFQSSYYLNVPFSAMNNMSTWSIFLLINPISASNWIMVKQKDGANTYNVISMTYNTGSGGGGQLGTSGYLYWRSYNSGAQAVSTGAVATSSIQIVNLIYDGTNLYFYKNGTLEKTTTGAFAILNDTGPTNYTLGCWIQSGSQVNNGVTNFRLGELVSYSTNLNTTQRQNIEGYLAVKWGISYLLPIGHPYKTSILVTALSYLPLSTNSTDIGTSPQTVTTNGTVTYTTIGGKQAAYFNNSLSNYLIFPYTNQTNFTICFWLYPIDATYYTSVSITTTGFSPALQVDTSSSSVTVYTAMPNQWSNQPTGTTSGTGAWTHYAITINQTTFVQQLYLNGTLADTRTGSGSGISSRDRFILGKSGDNGRAYNGYIRQFAFFNSVLSANDVSNVYTSSA